MNELGKRKEINEIRKWIKLGEAEQKKELEENRKFGIISYPGKEIYASWINEQKLRIREVMKR